MVDKLYILRVNLMQKKKHFLNLLDGQFCELKDSENNDFFFSLRYFNFKKKITTLPLAFYVMFS